MTWMTGVRLNATHEKAFVLTLNISVIPYLSFVAYKDYEIITFNPN